MEDVCYDQSCSNVTVPVFKKQCRCALDQFRRSNARYLYLLYVKQKTSCQFLKRTQVFSKISTKSESLFGKLLSPIIGKLKHYFLFSVSYIYNHLHTVHPSISIRCYLSPFLNCLLLRGKTSLGCRAEIRTIGQRTLPTDCAAP